MFQPETEEEAGEEDETEDVEDDDYGDLKKRDGNSRREMVLWSWMQMPSSRGKR